MGEKGGNYCLSLLAAGPVWTDILFRESISKQARLFCSNSLVRQPYDIFHGVIITD